MTTQSRSGGDGSVDIVIVNYKSAADTLAGIHELGDWDQGTLWVVDNSEDLREALTIKEAVSNLPWVEVLVAPKNLGFGRACNLAFERSNAPYFLLLNPDARISGAHVLNLKQTLCTHLDCAAVSPNLYWNKEGSFLTPTGSPQSPYEAVYDRALTYSFRLASAIATRSVLAHRKKLDSGAPIFHVPMLSGAIMMLRRSAVLDSGGLFDPDYFMFFEDADLSLRLRRRGWRLAVLPSANGVHSYRHAAQKAGLMHASQQVFLSKHYPGFFRTVGGTSRLARITSKKWPSAWYDLDAPSLSSSQAWAQRFKGLGVVAISPSLMMTPALFRPNSCELTPLSAAEWKLLEPGFYTVLLSSSSSEPLSLAWEGFMKSQAPTEG